MKPEKKELLQSKVKLKNMAIASKEAPRNIIREFQLSLSNECVIGLSRKDAIRQLIIRTRNSKAGHVFSAKSLSDLEIVESLQTTYKGCKFYYGDSGKDDKNRVIYFKTDQNLKLMSTYSDWYCDGTFNISPTIFKQVYTFHIIIRGTTLPMLYALLPNKKQTTYKKLFRLISKHLTKFPVSINCDFEIAAINALKLVFECRIYGCYFHLCQSFWGKIQADGLKKWFNSEVRSTFRMTKALAFLPEEDVVNGFEYVKQSAPASTKSFITYIENNYIGKTKDGKRVSARFPISLWNLNENVKAGLPRTNNNVESWHSRIKPDVSKNLTVEKVVEFFRLEQNNMETDLVLLFSGETIKQTKKKDLVREEKLKKLINDYNVLNLDLFLNGITNLLDDKIKE